MRYMRSVPTNRARQELYQMMCEGSPATRTIITNTLNSAWHEDRVLGTWQLADAAQLDKHNGKEGTKAIRLINMLDPAGKLFFSKLHDRTQDDKYDFAYGSKKTEEGNKLFWCIMR